MVLTLSPTRYDSIGSWFMKLEEKNESIETIGRERVSSYHEFALNALLHYVWENNDFYRSKLKEDGYDGEEVLTIEDFEKISFMSSHTLREEYLNILTKQPLSQISKSTGTTGGKPTYIGHTLDELNKYYFYPKYPSLMSKAKNRIVANALPYEMSSSALTFHHEFSHLLGCTILPVGKGGAYSDPELALQFMKDWKADVIVTTPSYAIELFNTACELGYDIKEDLCITHIYFTGEGSSHAFRKKIEELWGCSSTILYGSLEAMLIGIECDNQDGFHLAEGHLFIEIVDAETGERLENGQQGELVVTTLLREGMPLIRYKTGDLAFIDETECSCGNALPRLYLRGRKEDQLTIFGEQYSPFYLENIIMQESEVGYNYRFLVANGEVKLEIEPSSQTVDKELLQHRIESMLEFHLNGCIEVAVVDKIAKTKGKVKRVVYQSE